MTQTEQAALIVQKSAKVMDKLYTGADIVNKFDENFVQLFTSKHNKFSTSQILDFFHSCQLSGADPRKRDAYLVGYESKNVMVHAVVHSYHFLLKQANKTGNLKGVECITEVREVFDPITGNDKKMIVAIATIHKKDNDAPTVFEAYWEEFVKTKYNGEVVKTWKEKPRVMLQKCAIANALRWAFPESLENIFIEEERSDILTESENSLTREEKTSAIETELSTPNKNSLDIEIKDVKTKPEQKKPSFKL